MLLRTKNNMKSIFFGIISIIFFITLLGCGGTKTDFGGLDIEGSEVRIYEVFGMDCPGCHGGLENLVNEIPGVKTSKGNWKKQLLMVVILPNSDVKDEAIYEAIKNANFTPGKRLK